MTKLNPIQLLTKHDIKPTTNRLLVLNELIRAKNPQSLLELEAGIDTLERSSILRTLGHLLDRHIIHVMEDGKGVCKYEICRQPGHCSVEDMHAHFYCYRCRHTYCLENCPVPLINLPEGYLPRSANFMFKGLCPSCAKD